ncbi:chaperonin 10-like protein [Colletotrichum godetiae]|uniref:Chaperonin 10-like protein n=1 Tax=Colletotrichum godetiae TaxID=1209918 RepID=A0AAJ0A665_9PEZI|nr:chaperonin 10-like protein [Colletotrichum godetiae]KAK1657234.1 chaperonin 10-like protein [Colletotrichum godetiae]
MNAADQADERATPTNAIAVVQQNRQLVVENVPLPELQPHQVYVAVEWAAFNPTDRLAFDVDAFGDGAVLGCDFVGTVTRAHPNVSKLQVGDRIAALVWGGEIKGVGAYSSYCIADERISFTVPSTIESLKACAIPLAANTAYLALFSEDCLGLSRDVFTTKPPVLIWGGSSVVGYFAIQLAKLHGYSVATTCSPRNFDYVKNAGATYVFDYNDVDVVSNLQTTLPKLSHVFDTIGNTISSATAAAALNGRPGVLCTVRPGKANTDSVPSNIKVTDVFVFTAFPTAHTYRGLVNWPVSMPSHILSAELYEQLPSLLQSKSISPPPVKIMGKLGPQPVMEAMALNRDGKISAEKLCFEVYSALEKQHA